VCPNGTGRKLTYLSIQEGNKPMKKKMIKESGKIHKIQEKGKYIEMRIKVNQDIL